MARKSFTGKLARTTVRPDGPAGQPLTQALFHSQDADSIVAVWHDTPPPIDLTIGHKYEIYGHIVQYKGKTFLFRPEVRQILRHLLLRPFDWSRFARITSVGGAILLAIMVTLGMNYAASRDQQQRSGTSMASSYRSGANASMALNGPVTGTDSSSTPTGTTPTPPSTPATTPSAPAVTNAADCVTQNIPFTSKPPQTDASLDSGLQRVATPGVPGIKKVCYPNGRTKPAVTTILKQPVSQLIVVGSKVDEPLPAIPSQPEHVDVPAVPDPPVTPPSLPPASDDATLPKN